MLKKMLATIIMLSMSLFAFSANAALVAADVTALGTEVTGDIAVVKAEALPIVFTVLALMLGIKILKRIFNKA